MYKRIATKEDAIKCNVVLNVLMVLLVNSNNVRQKPRLVGRNFLGATVHASPEFVGPLFAVNVQNCQVSILIRRQGQGTVGSRETKKGME